MFFWDIQNDIIIDTFDNKVIVIKHRKKYNRKPRNKIKIFCEFCQKEYDYNYYYYLHIHKKKHQYNFSLVNIDCSR
jgi:hypothetical protein